jgi:polar amino acid transport system substrate-binding protein
VSRHLSREMHQHSGIRHRFVPRRVFTVVSGVGLVGVLASLAACGGSATGSATASSSTKCTPKHSFATISKGYLTVAAFNLPPYGTLNSSNQIGGVDGTIIKDIASMECLKIDVVPSTNASGVPDVQTGRADVAIPAYYATAARAQIVTLTCPLYSDVMTITSRQGIANVNDLKGHTVGSANGNPWQSAFEALLGSDYRTYQTEIDAANDLVAGRIDALISGAGFATPSGAGGKILTGKGFKSVGAQPSPLVPTTETPGQVVFPHTQGNTKLTAALNADIGSLRSDGTIPSLLSSYGFPAAANNVESCSSIPGA